MDMWHSRQTSANIWLSACDKLRRDIARIDREMQHFLKTHGGDEQTSTQRQVASPYAMAAAASTPMHSTSQQDPIAIKASASDKGLSVEIGQDSLVIVGVAEGPEPAYDIFGLPVGDYARSVRFTLDIDKAPTTNIFGQTDYSIQNRRIFLVYTSKGATALQMAQALARKVNDGRDFRASAHPLSPDRAQLNFTRR